jgi:hypothetical protein
MHIRDKYKNKTQMKHIPTFEKFINESNRIDEIASNSEIKKVEDFLKKNAEYNKSEELYVWNDAGVEFDVTLGKDKITLYDGEEDTVVSYKEFIKSWISESNGFASVTIQ